MDNMNTKTTRGRQKIDIKKIEKVSNRQVTFSKRRAGLFRKASELCILSGAEIAIIVQSPGNRTFAFGHPNIDATIDKYLVGGRGSSSAAAVPPVVRNNKPSPQVLNQQYHEIEKELEAEKKRSAMMESLNKVKPPPPDRAFWWQEPVESNKGLEELESYVAALEELKKNVRKRAASLTETENQSGCLSIVPRGVDFTLGKF